MKRVVSNIQNLGFTIVNAPSEDKKVKAGGIILVGFGGLFVTDGSCNPLPDVLEALLSDLFPPDFPFYPFLGDFLFII